MFWRVYRHAVVLVLVAGVGVFLGGQLVRGDNPWRELQRRQVELLAARYSDLLADRPGLERELARALEILELEVTVWQGERLAGTNVQPPIPAPPQIPSKPDADWEDRRLRIIVPLREGAVAVAHGEPWPERAFGRQLVALLLFLGLLGLVSYPFARGLIRPLERLTDVVRRFGRGEHTARAEMRGHDEVAQLAQAFDDMAGQVQRTLAGQRALLANVSHELRTPLARMRMAAELAEGHAAPEVVRYLEEINLDVGELDRMLEELVTAVRLDLAAPLSRTPVEAVGWVERVVERFHGLHPTLTVRIDRGAGVEGAQVEGDAGLLRRVLDNLLENAAKHGAPPFAVELSRAERAGQSWVDVRVRDQGPGIPPDEIERLFEPFARGAVARAAGVPGSGLGLALARRIVTAHGGTLTLERADSGGTCFCVSLPRLEGQGA